MMFINPLSNEKWGMGQRFGNFFKNFRKAKNSARKVVFEGLRNRLSRFIHDKRQVRNVYNSYLPLEKIS
ncbi:hypothetical protein D4L85_21715 [Chryseolinea soli]|uniref:Uncharacterized protein n=1 Tax=Chryseolinea soli TaxID=2321403 RepID=A0A385SMN7_9BACT|nr:hypothetical protein D4L85_21715 [Chryseolinea soli]